MLYTDGEGKKGDTETKETQILQEAVSGNWGRRWEKWQWGGGWRREGRKRKGIQISEKLLFSHRN